MYRPLRFAVLLLAGATLAFSAYAQPAPDDQDAQSDQSAPAADPPTRVARLSYLHGDVSFVPAGENDWVEAQLNRPLITGDKLWTDRGSRAEMNIGQATLRIDQNTSFDFLNLDDRSAQVELTQGSLNLHVRRLYDEQTYEIDTPTLAFVINRVGDFRIDVLPNGQATVVTVLQGGGDAYGEGGARFRIEEGQSVTFNDPQLQDYASDAIPRPDDFDQFCQERDRRGERSASRRYVSEEVIGYEDLDDNGEWTEAPEYGAVWYPTTVAVGWSPYHHGHWGWVGAYGWTWIDDAPWGFAPFHYGRWAYINNRWGWCPGPVAVRAVYAPALVAFVGGGVGVSVGFGSGPVGWFPLGPRDVYFPSYRVSEHYFTSINISNTRVINNVTVNNYYGGYRSGHVDYASINYTNRGVAGAIVAVPHEAFVGARPVAASAIAVNRETFANSRVSGFAAVAPTRASLVATTAVARAAPPAAVTARPIVAATKPPAPVVPFAQRQAVLQQNPGRPLSVNQLQRPVAAGPAGATGRGPAGAAAVNTGVAARPNVKVVTNTGAPVHTAAPVLPARPAGAAGPAAVNGGRPVGPANGANPNANANAATNLNRGAGPANRNLPAVQTPQNNAATQNAGNANGGRPAANTHLDSSRFAHPQAGGAPTGNAATGQPPTRATGGAQTLDRSGNNGQPPRATGPQSYERGNPGNTGQPHATGGAQTLDRANTGNGQPRATGGAQTLEHGNSGGGNNPRYTPADRSVQPTNTPHPAVTQPAPHANQNVERATGNPSGGNPNAYSRDNGYNRGAAGNGGQGQGQGRPEYHAAPQAQPQQQYHPQGGGAQGGGNSNNTGGQMMPQHAQPQQVQPQQHVQPQSQPQPQVQRVPQQPPPQGNRPQPQGKDKDKDKDHGR